MTLTRVRTLKRYALAGMLVATVGAGPLGAIPASATLTYPTNAPMILQNVSPEDLLANTRQICNGAFTIVIRNVLGATNTLRYLDAAQHCGVKAIVFFQSTVSGGTVYPSRVAALVNAVKNHPALYGYLSVKEPNWVGISGSEIRSLYKAFHAADPRHPVVALFGDIPHFGGTSNPYTAGMADIVMVDWYPVETASSGCSSSGTSYVTSGPKWYSTRVYPKIHTLTPNAKIWVMVQTHKNLNPTCHKKQRPSQSLLYRQVREAFRYAHATGIAFHTFQNNNYTLDERRDGTMVSWMRQLSAAIRAGTFQ
ncbi:MAG TPA: hypothetical protein VK194_11505 [Candidatus Deferrimicrobium sp.]|nr:hypothetical protein [Candidatus Deferrimicrobium sp.]